MDPNTGRPFEGTGVPTALSGGHAGADRPAHRRGLARERLAHRHLALGQRERPRTRGLRRTAPRRHGLLRERAHSYVTETDSDSVSFLDVAGGRVAGNLSLRPRQDPLFGQMPTDVVPSADGRRLYVALGGVNAVAVARLGARPVVEGYLPTGWYPIALGLAGDCMLVASAKGIGARPSDKKTAYGVHDSVGTFQSIRLAEIRNLGRHSRTVAANNRWNESPKARANRRPVPIPQRLGEPSVFKHVVYIIKENLTYDSTMGDMREGNGDPSLCTFPEEVSPNHHALAREFVLLDNFYTSGTNSADGHQWTSSSVANGYTEQNYAANTRSYPYDGGDPLAFSPEGFLWTAASKANKSVRVFGEFVDKPRVIDPATGKAPTWTQLWQDYKSGRNGMIIEAHTSQAALRPHLHPRYIGFPSIVSDQWRADQFLGDLAQWEKDGRMPDLSILLLPNDHTVGTRPGFPTPRAAVADHDLALGRMIEAITKSRFWKDTLILVVQDDSQLGVDHVDGHRSIAFCVSPYTRRGTVVREPYNHTSFVRTMGLVLGIPPMNRFDRTGTPLTACFTTRPDPRPYTARPNRIPLDEMNPPARQLQGQARALALACEKLDWSGVDRAHASTVARAVWHSAKPNVPFPERFYRPPADQD